MDAFSIFFGCGCAIVGFGFWSRVGGRIPPCPLPIIGVNALWLGVLTIIHLATA